MHTTMWFFGMAFRFPILFYLGGSVGNTGQTSLRMMKKGRRSYVFKIGTVRSTARFWVIPGFWPRWALSWPESFITVPATLVIGLMFTNLANQMGTTLHLAPARTGACVDAVHVIPRGWKAHQRGVAGAAGFPGGKQCKLRKFNRGKPNSWDRVGYYPLAN